MAGLPVQECAHPLRGPHALAQHRHVYDSDHGTALVEQGEQRPEERHSMDERLGAVDGIDHPLEPGFRLRDSMLLPDHAMVGAQFGETPPHQGLRFAVGFGDRSAVALLHHFDLLLVARQDGPFGLLHQTQGKVEFGFEIVRGHDVQR